MWFRKTLEESRGRKISRQDNDMYKSRGVVQSNGRTLCPALAELIKQKSPVDCDERIYQGLEQAFKEKNKRKNPILNTFVLMAIFMILASIRNALMNIEVKSPLFIVKDALMNDEVKSPLFIVDLRIICIAAVYLILRIMYRKKTEAKLNAVRRCIEQREGITAFYFYISELCWCDTSDADSITHDAYLFAENILFNVSYDTFNSACPGDYFMAAVVDTGTEKLFYIVNYR